MCGRWRGAWGRAGWRVWDLSNGTIMLQKLFNHEWQITPKSFLIGFSFSLTAEISRLAIELEWRKFAAENRVKFSKRGLDRSQMEHSFRIPGIVAQLITNIHWWRAQSRNVWTFVKILALLFHSSLLFIVVTSATQPTKFFLASYTYISFTDYSTGFGGTYGVQTDRVDKVIKHFQFHGSTIFGYYYWSQIL